MATVLPNGRPMNRHGYGTPLAEAQPATEWLVVIRVVAEPVNHVLHPSRVDSVGSLALPRPPHEHPPWAGAHATRPRHGAPGRRARGSSPPTRPPRSSAPTGRTSTGWSTRAGSRRWPGESRSVCGRPPICWVALLVTSGTSSPPASSPRWRPRAPYSVDTVRPGTPDTRPAAGLPGSPPAHRPSPETGSNKG
jgi:hypothetical protein